MRAFTNKDLGILIIAGIATSVAGRPDPAPWDATSLLLWIVLMFVVMFFVKDDPTP